ncbi:hypothetical protein MTR_2g426010 [Medicago truncatula]|uniref:Uncharacterized protein n=1 Tax=Medicago truncatula TaxID=3880 RepID=A0A072V6I5_MEDTR|nr:hypothetical protein MTR_2g426010 [Medicago truncatula]
MGATTYSLSIQPFPQDKVTNSITRNNLSILFQLHITGQFFSNYFLLFTYADSQIPYHGRLLLKSPSKLHQARLIPNRKTTGNLSTRVLGKH